MPVQGIYLALGANLRDRQQNIAGALRLLAPDVQVEAVSPLYESEPFGGADQPLYLNGACRVATDLAPKALLHFVKEIEKQLGRRPAERWASRPIDIDIALYGDLVTSDEELTIPHPRLLERAFVLRPLVDLDPDLVHPVTGERLADVLNSLGEGGLIRHSAGLDKMEYI